jgi:S1-C subfamily serine protease
MTGNAIQRRCLHLILAGALLAIAVPSHTFAAARKPDFPKLIDQHADTIVTITFVMKLQMGMMPAQETESEIPGVVVDSKGLVLCSNSNLLGPLAMLSRFMPPGMAGSAEPTKIKVIIGADDEEYDAKVVVRDKDLDLAWIQIENTEGKSFKAVDLPKEKSLSLGDDLVCVKRMGKFFNRVPIVRTGLVCGVTESPRTLYVTSTDIATSIGLPVFTSDGKLAGMVVMQAPDADESAGPANPLSMIGSMGSLMEMFTGVIMPVKQVARATKRVQETYVKENTNDEK